MMINDLPLGYAPYLPQKVGSASPQPPLVSGVLFTLVSIVFSSFWN